MSKHEERIETDKEETQQPFNAKLTYALLDTLSVKQLGEVLSELSQQGFVLENRNGFPRMVSSPPRRTSVKAVRTPALRIQTQSGDVRYKRLKIKEGVVVPGEVEDAMREGDYSVVTIYADAVLLTSSPSMLEADWLDIVPDASDRREVAYAIAKALKSTGV